MASRVARTFETLLLPVGIGALAFLIYQVGAEDRREILELTTVIGWWFALIVLQEFGAHAVNAAGLMACMPMDRLGFWRTFAARLAGEAVNATMPTATVGGELLKISLLARRAPVERVTAGISMAYAGQALTQMLFTAFALPLALPIVIYGLPVRIAFASFVFMGLIATWWMTSVTRSGAVFGRLHRLLRWVGLGREGSTAHSATERIDTAARGADAAHPNAFTRAVLLFLVGWFWGVIEVAIVLHACGIDASFAQCVAIEALSVFIDAMFFFVPGQMGTREGGLAGITYALGLGLPIGLSLGLVRRARQLIWAGIGMLCLAWFRRYEPLAPSQDAVKAAESAAGEKRDHDETPGSSVLADASG